MVSIMFDVSAEQKAFSGQAAVPAGNTLLMACIGKEIIQRGRGTHLVPRTTYQIVRGEPHWLVWMHKTVTCYGSESPDPSFCILSV